MNALDVLRESHARAMDALAADVYPYTQGALRAHEEAFEAALADLDALVQAAAAVAGHRFGEINQRDFYRLREAMARVKGEQHGQ